jgi:DNA-binding MarR family transcriptional regulator
MPDHIPSLQAQHARMMEQVSAAARMEQITAAQAIMIMNIGTDCLTAGEIQHRGYYTGSNVTYNLSRLHKLGLVGSHTPSRDRRKTMIALTASGLDLCIRLRRKLAVKQMEAA